MHKDAKFDTMLIHAGQKPDALMSVNPPSINLHLCL